MWVTRGVGLGEAHNLGASNQAQEGVWARVEGQAHDWAVRATGMGLSLKVRPITSGPGAGGRGVRCASGRV